MKKPTSGHKTIRWEDKEFHSLDDITFEDLLGILNDWETGKIASWDVNELAEGLVELNPLGWPDLPVDDPRSTLFEILHMLEWLYGNRIFKEDIPILKETLILSQTSPETAQDILIEYFDHIDYDARDSFIKERYSQGLLWPP